MSTNFKNKGYVCADMKYYNKKFQFRLFKDFQWKWHLSSHTKDNQKEKEKKKKKKIEFPKIGQIWCFSGAKMESCDWRGVRKLECGRKWGLKEKQQPHQKGLVGHYDESVEIGFHGSFPLFSRLGNSVFLFLYLLNKATLRLITLALY